MCSAQYGCFFVVTYFRTLPVCCLGIVRIVRIRGGSTYFCYYWYHFCYYWYHFCYYWYHFCLYIPNELRFYCKVSMFNTLEPELNPICYLLALLVHHFLHVSRIRVKSLTFRRLLSYIYIYIYIWSTHS